MHWLHAYTFPGPRPLPLAFLPPPPRPHSSSPPSAPPVFAKPLFTVCVCSERRLEDPALAAKVYRAVCCPPSPAIFCCLSGGVGVRNRGEEAVQGS
eukprot:3170668-Rhodomonas_salina.1